MPLYDALEILRPSW